MSCCQARVIGALTRRTPKASTLMPASSSKVSPARAVPPRPLGTEKALTPMMLWDNSQMAKKAKRLQKKRLRHSTPWRNWPLVPPSNPTMLDVINAMMAKKRAPQE